MSDINEQTKSDINEQTNSRRDVYECVNQVFGRLGPRMDFTIEKLVEIGLSKRQASAIVRLSVSAAVLQEMGWFDFVEKEVKP